MENKNLNGGETDLDDGAWPEHSWGPGSAIMQEFGAHFRIFSALLPRDDSNDAMGPASLNMAELKQR